MHVRRALIACAAALLLPRAAAQAHAGAPRACTPHTPTHPTLTLATPRTVAIAGAFGSTLQIVGAGETASASCAVPPCARAAWVQLRNGHAWSPADLSSTSLRLVRRLDAPAHGSSGGDDALRGLRLVSELHFGDAKARDPDACSAVLGDGGVPPGGAVTVWQGTRCGFSFVPLQQGDTVQLLDGAREHACACMLLHAWTLTHARTHAHPCRQARSVSWMSSHSMR
jgi:hypothetical protein